MYSCRPCAVCQAETEKLGMEEAAASAARDKEQLGQIVHSLEQELEDRQEEVRSLQVRGDAAGLCALCLELFTEYDASV